METARINSTILSEMDRELKSILNYWSTKTIDFDNGGFVGEIDSNNDINKDSGKGAVLNARLLWTFSAAYNFYKEQSYLALADRAYNYIINQFWDNINGGVYWELNKEGTPINTRKQAYAQGFTIYGLSEYYKASGNKKGLEMAVELYNLIEQYFLDIEFGGYIEALAQDWKPLEDMRLSTKDANEPKSMNTHLHIIEPYVNLYRIWPEPKLKQSIQHLLEVFYEHIINHETSHFHLFFDLHWNVKSDIVSFGHDIEGAWLLTEAAEVIGDDELLRRIKTVSLNMVNATMKDGMDKDGSFFYEIEDGHLDTDKHWWPQAEAMVGLMDAYQNSDNEEYLSSVINVWQFIKSNLIDNENGEWFWSVNQNGEPNRKEPKAGFWKCPYHNSRALIEIMNRVKH